MRGHSSEYARAVLRGGQIVTRLDVLGAGLSLASTANPDGDFKVSGGSVKVDRTAPFRRSFSAAVVNPSGALVPNTGDDLLSTLSGHEVAAFVGYRLPDGTEEMFSQGVFGLAEDDPDDQGSSFTIGIRGYDRMRQVARNGFIKPYVVANGSNGVAAVQALIEFGRPGTEFRTVPTALTVPRSVFDERSNPADAARIVADSFGYEVFFDADGWCVIQPEPDPAVEDPVWDYTEGPGCSLSALSRPSSNEKAHNGLILVGDSTYGITPARAVVWDTDPASPTYHLGPYGKYPEFETDSSISSQAQVNAAAAARFRRRLGAAETVSMSMVPNPALEEGDVVQVARARLRLDAKLVIESFELPFTAGAMVAQCRERRVL